MPFPWRTTKIWSCFVDFSPFLEVSCQKFAIFAKQLNIPLTGRTMDAEGGKFELLITTALTNFLDDKKLLLE